MCTAFVYKDAHGDPIWKDTFVYAMLAGDIDIANTLALSGKP